MFSKFIRKYYITYIICWGKVAKDNRELSQTVVKENAGYPQTQLLRIDNHSLGGRIGSPETAAFTLQRHLVPGLNRSCQVRSWTGTQIESSLCPSIKTLRMSCFCLSPQNTCVCVYMYVCIYICVYMYINI